MKFSQKIFLITFVFVTISINFIGIMIINNNHKTTIDEKIENNISNLHNIINTLRFYDVTNIDVDLLKKDDIYYEVSQDSNIIYSNLIFDIAKVEDKIEPTKENIKVIICDEIMFMSVKTDNCNIILAEDIKTVFITRQEQIYFFIKVSIIFSFIIAFCLYIIIYFLTRRINKLNKTVKEIYDGDYSARVQNLGKDEVGKLGEAFNKMASSVESTINEIQRVSINRQNFIHNITHEIRTPLTSIIGYSSLIKDRKITNQEKIIEYNNKIYNEGNYLNLISQRLMQIVLLDNKKIELEMMDISQEIQQIINSMKYDYKEVNFLQEIEPNICFSSDKILLHSLITNIIKNGIMSYENNTKKAIMIFLENISQNRVLLKIIDNGKGISEEQLKKITEPFYTLNKDRNRQNSGMGLGLPLCIKICEVLGAKFNIQSVLGQGTCVYIEFII